MPKLAVISLGCAKNLVDTEIMLAQLVRAHWELTDDFSAAELILINTCGFIETAKEESINRILEMAEYKNPQVGACRKLIVAGCLVRRYAKELAEEITEVDYWIGLGELGEIAELIEEEARRGQAAPNNTPFLNEANLPRLQVTLPHTAYVKIAEGCDHRCAYCAIPIIKGGYQSRSLESILTETRSLVQAGVKEINLIAQDLTMYGRDLTSKTDLSRLITALLQEAEPEWLRLLYLYPSGVTPELLSQIATDSRICNYLDLPVQHINPRILKMMNRHDPPELILERLAMIRRLVPGIVLRSTMIVGFPTETEAEFEELLQFVKTAPFEHLGVFAYSREEETQAFDYQPQVPAEISEERRERLMLAQQENSLRFLRGFVGKELQVLVDKSFAAGKAIARTAWLAPESDGVVYLKNYYGKTGEFVNCRITDSDAYNLYAELIL